MTTSSPAMADDAAYERAPRPRPPLANRIREASRRHHPAVSIAATAVAGYVAACAVLIGIGLLITHGLHSLSRSELGVNRWFVDHRTSFGNDWTGWASRIADTIGILVALAVVVTVLLLRRRGWSALQLALALALEVLTFITVNTVVGRPRPEVERLGSLPSTSSFPSGHTSAMIAIYGSLAIMIGGRSRLRTAVCWVLAILATVAVAYARVYRGMHHLSDVTAGALMGLTMLAVSRAAVRIGEQAAHRSSERDEHRESSTIPRTTAGKPGPAALDESQVTA